MAFVWKNTILGESGADAQGNYCPAIDTNSQKAEQSIGQVRQDKSGPADSDLCSAHNITVNVAERSTYNSEHDSEVYLSYDSQVNSAEDSNVT